MPATATPSTLFVNVVWGEDYVRSYLDLTLATELFPGNLPAFVASCSSCYRIYTDSAARLLIEGHPAFLRLRALLPVDFVALESLREHGGGSAKHTLLNACHIHALRDAATRNDAVAFLAPDVVWADGSFRALVPAMRAGCRTVLAFTALRLEKERFCAAFAESFSSGGELRPLDAPALTVFALQHLHPDQAALEWTVPSQPTWPSFLIWRAGAGAGLVVHSFHYHPLWVWPVHPGVIPETTIDGSYIVAACPDPATWHIVTDYGTFCVFEFSAAAQRRLHLKPGAKNPVWLGAWVSRHCDAMHRHMATQVVCYAANPGWPGWPDFIQASAQPIEQALALAEGRVSRFSPAYWQHLGLRFYQWQKDRFQPLRRLSRQVRTSVRGR